MKRFLVIQTNRSPVISANSSQFDPIIADSGAFVLVRARPMNRVLPRVAVLCRSGTPGTRRSSEKTLHSSHQFTRVTAFTVLTPPAAGASSRRLVQGRPVDSRPVKTPISQRDRPGRPALTRCGTSALIRRPLRPWVRFTDGAPVAILVRRHGVGVGGSRWASFRRVNE